MITLLSPAKSLDYDTTPNTERSSSPRFDDEQHELLSKLKTLNSNDISALMGISDSLADLNYRRFQSFDVAPTRQALLTFNGHVYRDIDWPHYDTRDYEFAQAHLRILSGFYGLLRPLDLIKPYRLEMGTKLKTSKGSNLYEFWGAKITRLLQDDLQLQNDNIIVNLASNEYAKAFQNDALEAQVVQPIFKDWSEKSSSFKIVSVYAKIARGTMTNWIIRNRINTIDDLHDFSEDGYALESASDSKGVTTLIFHRKTLG